MVEEADLLQAVAGQFVVRVARRHRELGLPATPARASRRPAVRPMASPRASRLRRRRCRPGTSRYVSRPSCPPCSISRSRRTLLPYVACTVVPWNAPAVLGLHRQRATQRVQPEERVRPWHQRRRGDRHPRNQIPADHVTERLVQADAVHVDGEALRRAEQRRRRVATVIDVGLKRVALDLIDVHAVEAAVEKVREVEGAAVRELAVGGHLDGRRHLRDRHLDAGERRRADHRHGDLGLERSGRLLRGRVGLRVLRRLRRQAGARGARAESTKVAAGRNDHDGRCDMSQGIFRSAAGLFTLFFFAAGRLPARPRPAYNALSRR